MSYIESKMIEFNSFGKINQANINAFFRDLGFFDHGMDKALSRARFLNSHDSDKLGIADQVEKINVNIHEANVPTPTNLLTALIYIRRISYLYMIENGLEKFAKDSELMPVMIEGLFIDYITGSDNRVYIGAYYYDKEKGYITELKKISGATSSRQYNEFYTAYELQNDLVEYYKNNTKEFYKYLDKAKKGKIEFFDIASIAKETNEKNLKKKIKRR